MSKVVVVKFIGARPAKGLGKEEYLAVLTTGLLRLTGESKIATAISKYLPSGIIGMKTNCLARRMNSTPVALVDALSDLLVKAGFAEDDLVVWERTSRELVDAGFTLNVASHSRRCLGTDTAGVGYSEEFYNFGDVDSLVSRIMTEVVDYNINLPVLKDHSVAGLSGGLKNMYGAIHNPNKWHGNNCDPYCAHVSNLGPIKTRNRLTITNAIRVQYNGGPGFIAEYVSDYGGVIFSDDPVAADRVGLEIVEHLRSVNGHPTLERAGRPANYLRTAEKIGMGVADLKQISLAVINVDATGGESAGDLF